MYLDTANITQIKNYSNLNWVQGVTTNPSLLRIEKTKSREKIIENIVQVLNGKILFVQIEGESYKDLKKDAEFLLNHFSNENIGLKVQADEKGYDLINYIKEIEPNRQVLATVIFSVEQAYLSGLVGADYIAPYINRMENASIDPFEVIQKTKKLYGQQGIQTRIMGASFKNQHQIMETLLSGAETVTTPVNLLHGMLNNKLARESIDVFNQHAQERRSNDN